MSKQPTGGGSELDKKKEQIRKDCAELEKCLIAKAEHEEREDNVLRDRPKIENNVRLAKQFIFN